MTSPEAARDIDSDNLLLIFRQSPYGTALAREGLEVALAMSAMGIKTSVLFINDGVWQLTEHQNSRKIQRKNHFAMASALPIYGVKELFVDKQSQIERSLDLTTLNLPITLLEKHQVQHLLASNRAILGF
jgi:tRNA 2-thiouridine synthesizing protein C